ncbi:MAG: hypothetical protein QNJ90_09120 [Planctomycetota bacterium]|nr:hypothetical protein [Planctomycetota bacterium]
MSGSSDTFWTPSRKRWIGGGGALVAAGLIAFLIWHEPAKEEARSRGFGSYFCDSPKRVYYGRPDFVRKPCAVSADRIYERIPEYQRIKREGIPHDHPRYHLLMQKATQRFSAAVRAMAGKHGHDVVAEIGTCRANKPGVPEPPDRTNEVLAELP